MEKKNNLTELVFILDRSGSMAGLESDTVGGFNAMLEKQKKEEGDCLVSTVLFNDSSRVLHDRVPLQNVPRMTEKEYFVCGGTALIDAIGAAIRHVGIVHKYARKEDVPAKTVFVITTDGMENASRRYTAEDVRNMIRERKENYGWEFLFIGANIDAVETASHFGICEDRAVNYTHDSVGTHVLYDTVSEAICCARGSGTIDAGWSKKIDEDYRRRGKKTKK